MSKDTETFLGQVNHSRYQGQVQGHYESFFLRANHPERPLAFWIRYTVFSPGGRPEDAIGELWAVFFNGETHSHTAVKKEVPFRECVFSPGTFDVRVGDARLRPGRLAGAVEKGPDSISWDLAYQGDSRPLLLLPQKLYLTRLPAAKSLVSLPLASFAGGITVNGETMEIRDWLGSSNHNWGFRHTDLYAWGQVAGFDGEPGTFLEVATARIKIGPLWTPPLTPMVLRRRGKEYAANGLLQTVKAHGSFSYFTWTFSTETPQLKIEGTITAPPEAFVGLTYYNPPGGTKTCLNTKIASCTLRFEDKAGGTAEMLAAKHRAAFEILTGDTRHGIRMR
jgi:hypothetical protein